MVCSWIAANYNFIPENLLLKLYLNCPNIRLEVDNVVRRMPYRPMGHEPIVVANQLRPSPILHSLKYQLRWIYSKDHPGMAFRDTVSSEIPSLHAVVSNSPNLRILDLSINQAGSEKRASEGGGFGPLLEADIPSPLVSGYQFPQLESLTIPVRWPWTTIIPEAIPLLTCSLLNLAAKWNQIRQLKLTGLDPNISFRHLRGRVPNLKRLDIALQHSEVAVADFISSINRLEELRIMNYKTEIHLDILCAAIIKHQASPKLRS